MQSLEFHYKIFPEHGIIVERFKGELNIDGVITCTERLWSDPLYDKTYKGIADLTAATTSATPADIPRLIQFLVQNKQTSTGRWAAIFREPKSLALGMLVKTTNFLNPWLEVFSSWDAACRFIDVEIPETIFKDEIESFAGPQF